ncbi:MAG: DUF3500 domain-containing protein, partial [Phycicoccus sp.]
MTVEALGGVSGRPADLPIVDGILYADLLPPAAAQALTAAERHYRDPYVGITTSGTAERGLHPILDTGSDCRDAADAASHFIRSLRPNERVVANPPMDSEHWRLWTNALPTWTPRGLRLERLGEQARTLALATVEASLSASGFATVRDAMRLNGALGELVGEYRDTLTELAYYFTVFGEPGTTRPWGWQLMGHHVDLHCVFVGSQQVFAPVFVGAEPTFSLTGRYAGIRVLDPETELGLDLRRAMDDSQAEAFLLGDSLLSADLPEQLAGPFNGRHLAGAGADNLMLPYAGIPAGDLTSEQRERLLALVEVYTGRLPGVHAELKTEQVREHLDRTHFAWRGGHGDTSAFYYRVHSPVLLIEYDNHPGIFLDNPEPERFHV